MLRVSGHTSAAAPAPAVPGAQTSYAAYHLEFDSADACKAFSAPGIHVLTKFDCFADVVVARGDAKAAAALDGAIGLRWYDAAVGSVPSPPIPRLAQASEVARGVPEAIVRGGVGRFTGRGVIIALVDSGIDFRHPDFIDNDSKGKPVSRIRYLWDTLRPYRAEEKIGQPAPVLLSSGASLGTLYSRDDLTADLRGRKPQIADIDDNGHGTACASIAAGNGKAAGKKYCGVAPDADIIAVRIANQEGKLPSEYLLGAIAGWLDKVAGAQPLVISCSIGTSIGGRDGCLVQERQLDARFPLSRVGRALCVAAGNDAAKHFHGEVFAAGSAAPGKLSWNCPADSIMQVYANGNDPADLDLIMSSGVALLDPKIYLHPLSNHLAMALSVPKGKGSLTISSKAGVNYRIDAYLINEACEFDTECAQADTMLDSPGTAATAITVGSYNWNDRFEQGGTTYLLPGRRGDRAEIESPDDDRPAVGILFARLSPLWRRDQAGYRRAGTMVRRGRAAEARQRR